MVEKIEKSMEKVNRRTLGVHLTSTDIFIEYIFPSIKDFLYDYIWVDLYSGEGNLILPLLNYIPDNKKISFFKEHIFLFDVQEEMVLKSTENAISYGIPLEMAKKNIRLRNNLESFPESLKKKGKPIFHITNPPYLYLGYIRKHKETEKHLKYFEGENKGYQDLYQIAMINDLRSGIEDLIYIIPSNFIFGSAVSNKFRLDFLKFYYIQKMLVFETKIFEHTGQNICICFFKRKKKEKQEILSFSVKKFKKDNVVLEKNYVLKPEFKYRGGSEFDDFNKKYKPKKHLKVTYYLLKEDIDKNSGNLIISAIDTSNYISNQYLKLDLKVNKEQYEKIKSNCLFIRTVDTGSMEGRCGLYAIKDTFGVDGVYVSGNTYRTSPIHIFLEPTLSKEKQQILLNYFNFMLEHFRDKLDSEFLTTYKYSSAQYTRKYMGLTQGRSLIQTFPLIDTSPEEDKELLKLLKLNEVDKIIEFLKYFNKRKLEQSQLNKNLKKVNKKEQSKKENEPVLKKMRINDWF